MNILKKKPWWYGCYQALSFFLLSCAAGLLLALPVSAASEEKDWFDEHSTLTVGIFPRLPFEALTPEGDMVGLGPDLLRAIIAGRPVTIKTRQFKTAEEVTQALCAGKIDMALNVVATTERERCLGFSTSYLEDKVGLLSRVSVKDYGNLQNLSHARIGILGESSLNDMLRSLLPKSTLVHLSADEIVPALTAERIDVYIGPGALVDYLRVRAPNAGLAQTRGIPGVNFAFRFAVASNDQGLLAGLNNGLKKLTDTKRFSVISSWLGHYYSDGVHEALQERIDLTPLERSYLASLPPLALGYSTDWEPISFINKQGKTDGMLNDYLEYFSRTLGIRFERAKINKWDDIVKAAGQGQLDVVAGVAPGNKNFNQMLFSDSLGRYRLVLVQRQADPTFSSPDDVAGSRVAVVRTELLDTQVVESALPGVRIVETDSLKEALDLIEQGSVDACATSLMAVDLMIKRAYAGKLKVSLALNEPMPLSLALNERHSALLPLINRVLQALSESEMRQLRNKWLAPPVEAAIDWAALPWSLFVASLIALLSLLGAWYLYSRRRNETRARMLAEQRLADQVQLLQIAMDAMPHPMLIKNHDGRLLAINRAFEILFDLSRSEVIGVIATDVLPFSSTLKKTLADIRRNANNNGEVFVDEITYVDGKGNESIALFSMTPVLSTTQYGVIGMVGLLIDLSQSRRALALAEATGRRLRDLTENLTVVVFQLHQAPAGKLSFTFVSGNVIALFGISAEVMMADERNAMMRVVPEDRAGLEEQVRRSAATLKPVRPMFRVNNDGQLLWLAGHIVPRREVDGSVTWNGYWSDITKEHETASHTVTEAAQAASRAKDEFLAMMSHEIRTPMNGVMGLAEVLEDTPLSNDQAGLVKMMRDSAGTMLAILDDILDYSKIEAGHLSLSYTAVDLRQLCDQAFGLLAGRAQEKRLQLRVQVDAVVAARHIVDGTRLRQVLFNFLSNAIKFTAHGSIILRIRVAEDASDYQRLHMMVEDTGKGISKDQLSRLFEPFVQEDSSISRRFGGTGLGLSICRRLMTMMNGDITIDSIENVGTTAQLELTLAIAERDCSIASLRDKRVWLLLPDYNIRTAVQMYLTALGMVVVDDPKADLKIGISTKPGKIELSWGAAEGAARILQINANPVQWVTLRQACLVAVKGDEGKDVDQIVAPAKAQPRRDGRILVAEDNPTNQEVIRRFLARLHFDCDVVNNGLEAFAALRLNNYALVLTDCHMPELDGYALVRYIREIEHAQGLGRMPVVGITASTRPEDEQIARDAGMDACLVKPTGLTMLSDCIEKLLPQVAALAEVADEAERYQAFANFDLPGNDPISSWQLKHLEVELGAEGKLTVLRVFRDTLKQDLEVIPKYGDAELSHWLHRVKGAIAVMEFVTLTKAIDDFVAAVQLERVDQHVQARSKFIVLSEKAIAQIDGLLSLEEDG